MPNIVGLLCFLFAIFIVAWSLYPLNTSFSVAQFPPKFEYDNDLTTGNVDTSRYIYNNFTNFEGLPMISGGILSK